MPTVVDSSNTYKVTYPNTVTVGVQATLLLENVTPGYFAANTPGFDVSETTDAGGVIDDDSSDGGGTQMTIGAVAGSPFNVYYTASVSGPVIITFTDFSNPLDVNLTAVAPGPAPLSRPFTKSLTSSLTRALVGLN